MRTYSLQAVRYVFLLLLQNIEGSSIGGYIRAKVCVSPRAEDRKEFCKRTIASSGIREKAPSTLPQRSPLFNIQSDPWRNGYADRKEYNGLAVAEPASFSRVTLIRNKYSMRPLHKTIGKRFVNTTCFVSSQLINISCDIKYWDKR